MALFNPAHAPVEIVTVQQSSFPRVRASLEFRRSLLSNFELIDGLGFAVNMRALATRNGFGAGLGNPRRTVTLCAWRDAEAAREFLGSSLGAAGGQDWSVLLEVISTRGDHQGAKPLKGAQNNDEAEELAVLTLGTTSWKRLLRFMIHGSRMRRDLEASPGLLFATSAGWPTTGNSTFSVWTNSEAMQRFAYGDRSGHEKTAHARPPILTGQLNARMRVLEATGALDRLGPNAT